MRFDYRDLTDAELAGIVGGMGVFTKIQINRELPGRRPVNPFRGAVAAGGPAAAPAAPKAPRCSGPWCG